jgi:hypothetical protein
MQDIERVDSLAGWYTLEGAAQALGVSKKAVRYRVMRYRATVVRMGKNDLVLLAYQRQVYATPVHVTHLGSRADC